jgi:ribosomal protein RSM22 (predicted rRNA methylase)
MAAARDWCHFSQRVERTSLHRRLKQGELGYEDEKFSYVVLSRRETKPATARVVRHPLRHSGHVQLDLCTPAGVERRTVSRRTGAQYREAKKVESGSEFPFSGS